MKCSRPEVFGSVRLQPRDARVRLKADTTDVRGDQAVAFVVSPVRDTTMDAGWRRVW
jgi:hypothetical protein